ncbi:MAG: LTA synthase family protein [Eubacteriales bacterium]|nr:LTA synthase family protein [Eubacteriales bacterium]
MALFPTPQGRHCADNGGSAVSEATYKRFGARFWINLALTLAFAALLLPLLRKGSLSFLTLTARMLGVAALLPLALRPRRRASRAELLLHDLLLLLSAAAVSLILTEYIVKGLSVGMEKSFWQGWLCYAAIDAVLYLVSGRVRLAVCIGQGLSLVHALIDHYVMLFRGTPVMLSDVFSIGTAANVAQGYSAPVEWSVLWAGAATVLYCVCVCLMRRVWKQKRVWTLPVAALAGVVVFAGLQITGTGIGFWQSSRSYSEIFYFLRCANNSIVRKPEGYGADSLNQAVAAYQGEPGVKTPNLIVVMNESFSDLGVVGEFETNEDYMPYMHKLLAGKENTVSGELLVSTFGGGTANTEFEFLTGDTLGFLPFGCSPYQMYVKRETPNLTSGLAAQGYRTVSLHPYLATSWNREKVYERFGFQQQLYQDAFASDAARVRYQISDSEDYRKIFELYENKQPGQPLFVFNVTMQNHGGYEPGDDPNFEQRIHLTGEYEGKYPEVDKYLSLIRYSDEAVEELLDYFAAVDEPTAVIFFGDHQPNVPSAFYDDLFGNTDDVRTREEKQSKLITPFFIWANYEIQEADHVQISANYLSAYALDALGCATSAFDQMRLKAYLSVPRINSYGYYMADGQWHDAATVSEQPTLADYRFTQYAQLFDVKKRIDEWYEP